MTVWVILQGATVVAVFADQESAANEFAYLSYHGDGYTMTKRIVESAAGGYARRVDVQP